MKSYSGSVEYSNLIQNHNSVSTANIVQNSNNRNNNYLDDKINDNHQLSVIKIKSRFPPLCRTKTKNKIRLNIPLPILKRKQMSYTENAITKSSQNFDSNINNRHHLYLNISSDLLTHNTLSLQMKSIIHQVTQPIPSIDPIHNTEPSKGKTRKPTKKAETVKQFLNKTQELIKLRYISKIKAQSIERFEEIFEGNIETINDKMRAIIKVKKLFNISFCNKFNQYIKHLLIQRNAEKVELKRIKSEKVQSENDFMNIQFKIKLKERELLKKKKWYLLQKVFHNKFNPKEYHSNNQSKISETVYVKNNEIELFYQTPEEFILEFKKYEMYNLFLLNKFNDIHLEIKKYRIQQNIQLLELNNEVNQLLASKKQKKIDLIQLKTTLSKLEKEKIIKSNIKYHNFDKETSPQLYQSILSIYKLILNSAPKYLNNLKQKLPVDTTSMLSLLSFIERTVDFFLDKNANLFICNSLHNEKIYQVAKKKALKNRQTLLSIKIKQNNLNKTTKLVQKVKKKMNQMHYIPFRKVDNYYYQNIHKNSKKKKKEAINKTVEIFDFNVLLHNSITE